jgi:hypothetical protein
VKNLLKKEKNGNLNENHLPKVGKKSIIDNRKNENARALRNKGEKYVICIVKFGV